MIIKFPPQTNRNGLTMTACMHISIQGNGWRTYICCYCGLIQTLEWFDRERGKEKENE